MRRASWPALAFVMLLTLAGGAHAQTGGTLVLGLDQEPPTLDPHASPSAVTYQIIGSVTEGMETADKIAAAADAELPTNPIAMNDVSVSNP